MMTTMKPRVLYNNLLETASGLAMTNLGNDSLASNLYHPYLELTALCTAIQSVVTGNFAGIEQRINCIGIGYHNCDTVTLVLKDVDGVTILTKVITLEDGEALYYLGADYYANSFTITFDAGKALYVGYLGIGSYVELPAFSRGMELPLNLNSSNSTSRGGQVSGLYARALMGYSVAFPRFEPSDRIAMLQYLQTVQTVKPHMVDLFPEDHDYLNTFYGVVSSDTIDFTKRTESGFFYESELEWTEAR